MVLDEQVNVGILIFLKEDSILQFVYPNSLTRLTYLFPNIDLNWIKRNDKKKTGIKNEGELITTKIVTFDSLKFTQSASVIVGLKLLNNNKILK